MRSTKLFLVAIAAVAFAAPATAQYNAVFMADVIGQTVGNMNRGVPDACYDGRWTPKPKDLAMGPQRVKATMDTYLQVAAAGTDLKPVFTGGKNLWHWSIDGTEQDVRAARDPWAGRVASVEPVAFAASNQGGQFRAVWKAIAQDGSVLGTYSGWLQRWDGGTARFIHLDLYSAAAAKQPDVLVPFCWKPGDIAEWRVAKAKREAEKAAKRAAKEAARAAAASGGK